jgi:acyl-CoA synthetase (NDP forming)
MMVIMSARVADAFARDRDRLMEIGRNSDKPIIAFSYTWPSPDTVALLAEAGYALTTNIRNCARAMAALADYRELRDAFIAPRAPSSPETSPVLMDAAGSNGIIPEHAARRILAAEGIGASGGVLAETRVEAMAAAQELGGPLALKIQSADIPHKTDIGGVALNVRSPEEAGETFDRLMAAARTAVPAANIDGVLVEPMAKPGVEMILGIKRDDVFGPMILVGFGGIYAELIDDTVLSPPVANTASALALIRKLKCAPLLEGARGRPVADSDALAGTILALSRFAADNAVAVREIDLNPILVHENGRGVTVVDALIIVDEVR